MNGARKHTAGVTLTELLVVLLIIAILGTIAVPVYLNRLETARVRTAQAEVRELAQAEDMVAATHGFYVPLQMLDDVVEADPTTTDAFADTVDNEPIDLYLYKVNLPPTTQFAGAGQLQLSDADADSDVQSLVDNWQGPFINFNRFYKGRDGNTLKTNAMDSNTNEVSQDFPLDPWGQPYRFFGPLGILGNETLNSTPSSFQDWGNDNTFDLSQRDRSGNEDPYDRFAIVSFGPNQRANNTSLDNTNEGDDIIYMFGFVASETAYVP